jgi:hypothetical protein
MIRKKILQKALSFRKQSLSDIVCLEYILGQTARDPDPHTTADTTMAFIEEIIKELRYDLDRISAEYDHHMELCSRKESSS